MGTKEGEEEMEKVSTTAERLKTIMRRDNLRQVDIVRKTGMQKGTISLYVSGKLNPKQGAIEKMSKTLGVNALWLMGYDVPMTAETDPETVRNQVIVDITLRMQTDDQYKNAVLKLDKLDQKQLAAIVAILDTMVK